MNDTTSRAAAVLHRRGRSRAFPGSWGKPLIRGAGVVLAALAAIPSAAQEGAAPELKRIEIQEDDEVRALRAGRAVSSYAEFSERAASAPDDAPFLAAIDISKLDPTIAGGSAAGRSALAEDAVESLEDRTTYDAEGARATSFETRYEELATTLQCHWAYDATVASRLAELDAKTREAELEQQHAAERGAAPKEDEEPAPAAQDTDPEFDFVLKERQLTKAGRPCLLTVTCEQADDPRCSDKFLDELVKSVVLVREGAN